MPGTRPGMTENGAAPSSLDPALDRLLDDLFGGLRLRLLVARLATERDVDQFIDERDQQDHEADRVAELRDPQRDDDDALRHVVELPRLPVHLHRVISEERDRSEE